MSSIGLFHSVNVDVKQVNSSGIKPILSTFVFFLRGEEWRKKTNYIILRRFLSDHQKHLKRQVLGHTSAYTRKTNDPYLLRLSSQIQCYIWSRRSSIPQSSQCLWLWLHRGYCSSRASHNIIGGESSERLGSKQNVTVNASLSYDANVGPGIHTGLNFTWSYRSDTSLSNTCFGSFQNEGDLDLTSITIDPSKQEIDKFLCWNVLCDSCWRGTSGDPHFIVMWHKLSIRENVILKESEWKAH